MASNIFAIQATRILIDAMDEHQYLLNFRSLPCLASFARPQPIPVDAAAPA
jgi:hypothetical protein